jgi:hypothetical protein
MPQRDETIVLEDVKLIFRNFAGREGMYNREGDRNFAVELPKDVAEELAANGWNVKLRQRGTTRKKRSHSHIFRLRSTSKADHQP